MPLTKDLSGNLKMAHPMCVAKKVKMMGYTGDPRNAPADLRAKAARACVREGKLRGVRGARRYK